MAKDARLGQFQTAPAAFEQVDRRGAFSRYDGTDQGRLKLHFELITRVLVGDFYQKFQALADMVDRFHLGGALRCGDPGVQPSADGLKVLSCLSQMVRQNLCGH